PYWPLVLQRGDRRAPPRETPVEVAAHRSRSAEDDLLCEGDLGALRNWIDEERGGREADRSIVLHVEDSTGAPAVANPVARRLADVGAVLGLELEAQSRLIRGPLVAAIDRELAALVHARVPGREPRRRGLASVSDRAGEGRVVAAGIVTKRDVLEA